jgi:hypothetical protein
MFGPFPLRGFQTMSRSSLLALALPILLVACGEARAAAVDDGLDQALLERITAEIKLEVEELRGQKFPAKVDVAIADRDQFRAYVLARIEEMETPESIAADEEVAKLTGMLDPDYALVERMLELVESQVGGFYDPATKRFYLMEGFDGALAKIILAHELTHALDDQLYGLDEVLKARAGNTDAQWAMQAVIEGSGTELMNRWMIGHIAEIKAGAMIDMASMGMEELEEAPPYLWIPLIGAYSQGASFLGAAPDDLAIAAAVEQAFESPPRSSEQILHPEKYWDVEERDEPVEVAFEGLPEGWDVLDEDTLGELGLGLFIEPLDHRGGATMLSAAKPRLTWKAVKGWGGDRYVLLGRGDADRLLALATTWDREKDAREFEQAVLEIAEHIRAGPADDLRIARDGQGVLVLIARGAGAELFDAAPVWVR